MRHDLELVIIKLSVAITVVIGLVGLVIFYYSQSIGVLVDTTYTIVACSVYCFALFSAKKIRKPPDAEYHYGYSKIEPVAVVIQALLLYVIVTFALIMAFYRLFFLNVTVNYDIAIIYVVLSIIICFGMYILVNYSAKKTNSFILIADAKIWFVDGLLSVGIFLGFLVAYISDELSYYVVAQYADPIIAILIGLIILREPLKLLKNAMKDLLDASPGKGHIRTCEKIIDSCLKKNALVKHYSLKITKAGRKLFVDVGYELPTVTNKNELDELNRVIRSSLDKEFFSVEVAFYILTDEEGTNST